MARTRLLRAACAVAMWAAAPAFAQTNMPTGDTGAGGAPNNPTSVTPSPATPDTASATGSHAPPRPHAGMDHPSAHRSAMMTHHRGMMGAGHDLSQDAAVSRLNDQSYQAARSGQAYNGGGSSGANDLSGTRSSSGGVIDNSGK